MQGNRLHPHNNELRYIKSDSVSSSGRTPSALPSGCITQALDPPSYIKIFTRPTSIAANIYYAFRINILRAELPLSPRIQVKINARGSQPDYYYP
jgi:hypothetical protein